MQSKTGFRSGVTLIASSSHTGGNACHLLTVRKGNHRTFSPDARASSFLSRMFSGKTTGGERLEPPRRKLLAGLSLFVGSRIGAHQSSSLERLFFVLLLDKQCLDLPQQILRANRFD